MEAMDTTPPAAVSTVATVGISDRIGALLGQSGRLVHHDIVGGTERVVVDHALDPHGSVTMSVVHSQLVGTHVESAGWRVDIHLRNTDTEAMRLISMPELFGEMGSDRYVKLDTTLVDTGRYRPDSDEIIMGLPNSGLAWLAVLLHEHGHARQYKRPESGIVTTLGFIEEMGFLSENDMPFDKKSLDAILANRRRYMEACRSTLAILVGYGLIGSEKKLIIENHLSKIILTILSLSGSLTAMK